MRQRLKVEAHLALKVSSVFRNTFQGHAVSLSSVVGDLAAGGSS